MWFVGVILGLLLGAAIGSIGGAVFWAVVFGFIGMMVGRAHAKSVAAINTKENKLLTADAAAILVANSVIKELREKIAALEIRIGLMEHVATQGSVAKVQKESLAETAAPIANEEKQMAEQPAAAIAAQVQPMPSIAVEAPPSDILPPKSVSTSPPTPAPAAIRSPTRKVEKPAIPFKDRLPEPLKNFIYGGNTLVKVGGLILFLGLAFLLRYTAERVTVPIELRYAGVAASGAGILLLGWFLRVRRRDYGLVLQGMGIGVFYLTCLTAMKLHSLLPTDIGFAFMLMVSLLAAMLAILQKAPALAIIAALEGFATPVLASTGENHMIALFSYLSILNIGIVIMAWFNAWRILNLIGFVGTFALSSGWADKYYTDEQYLPVQLFLAFFFVLFTAVGIFFARRTLLDAKEEPDTDSLAQQAKAALATVGRVDSALVFGVPITAFGLQYLLTKQWEFGPAFSALIVAAFYLLLARQLFSGVRSGLRLLGEAYAIVAVIFISLAIPLGLEGAWTSSAWAVEGAGMYWLGVRQRRPYARAFTYLVLLGATYKLLHAITINTEVAGNLLVGSTIGPVLLAASALLVWAQHRKAQFDVPDCKEFWPGKCLPWLGIAALAILPWQWFVPPVAAAACAGLSLIVYFSARRSGLAQLLPVVTALQALAVASFIFTLHSSSPVNDGGAGVVFASGRQGLFAALAIALCILCSTALSMVRVRNASLQKAAPPVWSLSSSLAVVVGVLVLHLAMLFAIDVEQAALIWPITACLVLWVALRMVHRALALTALGLQLVSLFLFAVTSHQINIRAFNLGDRTPYLSLHAFAHLRFWIPLVFALSAGLCADWIRAEAAHFYASVKARAENQGAVAGRWINLWCTQPFWSWLALIWGVLWWLFAWFTESNRVLEIRLMPQYFSAVAVAIILVTSVLMIRLAGWRQWRQIALASEFTLSALILIVLTGLVGIQNSRYSFIPSADLGWLVWPLALLWHLRLLAMQSRWSTQPRLAILHVLGFWFFLALAARECQYQFGALGTVDSSWALLGWMLVPALSFWALRSSLLLRRWPLNAFRKAYLEVACVPVAAYLFGWCFVANILSTGDAAPLPYLPFMNPLELAQWMVMLALMLWWHALAEKAAIRISGRIFQPLMAALGLLLITGMVLRSCHHFAGIAWEFNALFDSRLAQAALAITWAGLGVFAMLLGNRRSLKLVWIAGAALLAVVVLKLLTIDLADHGGLYRIVSFIGVGILLLVVGYFAPVPTTLVSNSSVDEAANTNE